MFSPLLWERVRVGGGSTAGLNSKANRSRYELWVMPGAERGNEEGGGITAATLVRSEVYRLGVSRTPQVAIRTFLPRGCAGL